MWINISLITFLDAKVYICSQVKSQSFCVSLFNLYVHIVQAHTHMSFISKINKFISQYNAYFNAICIYIRT